MTLLLALANWTINRRAQADMLSFSTHQRHALWRVLFKICGGAQVMSSALLVLGNLSAPSPALLPLLPAPAAVGTLNAASAPPGLAGAVCMNTPATWQPSGQGGGEGRRGLRGSTGVTASVERSQGGQESKPCCVTPDVRSVLVDEGVHYASLYC